MNRAIMPSSSSGDLSALLETSQRCHAWARGVVLFGAVLRLLGAFCIPAQAQILAPNWNQQSPAASPPARYIHAITYDVAHGQVVLFGGFGGSGDLNDTWLRNGINWTQVFPTTSPSARSAHAMVYDAAHNQVVMFGGLVGVNTRLGDTWLWDGTNWTHANPAHSPSPRDGAVMVYDAASNQVVLFGGTNGFDLGDTWVWSGTDWTQLSPATSPSARADYSMAYDAAHSQVVLFGGRDGSGNYLNDTWAWNGTTWTQQIPATSPPARYAQGMAYDAAQSQVVMFGGYNGGFLNDTWVWNGTNWIQQSPAASPSGRYAPNAITYDVAQGQVVLFGGLSSSQFNDTWVWGLPGNFGNVSVCPSGQPTQPPCSGSLTLTYNIATTTTFGTTQVVTQGTTGLDFTAGSGSTCTGTVSTGTCTVNVTFTPLAPGLRMGAVQLFDNSGNQLAITPIYGVGQGPAMAFAPGTQTTVNTTASYPLNQPKGVAVDAAGNVFIADNGNQRVVKVASDGTVTTVGIGLNYPQGLAVDGAGNLFIADNNRNEVVEVPAGCTSSGCQIILGSNLAAQLGVAVDGQGDLFIGDFTGNKVVEIPTGCTSVACQAVVYGGPGSGSEPVGVAVDAAGNLFVADFGLGKVMEVPAGCNSSSCQTPVGSGWVQPEAVAVDAAGDVFVADEAPKVVEIPAGCTSSACQITVSGLLAYGVAVDGKGDLFIPDLTVGANRVVVLNRSQAPSLSFATTNAGSTSSDSPQSFTIQDIGNQTLTSLNAGLIVGGPNFVQVAGPGTPVDCSPAFALTPGAACNVSISFKPQTGGNPLNSKAVFTDNALNGAPTTQTVNLSGIGVALSYTIGGSVTGLAGSGLVLQDNSGNNLPIGGNGPFTFSGALMTGVPYSVTVFVQPSSPVQNCVVTNGSGTVANANITNVQVSCTTVPVYALTVSSAGTGTGTVTDNLAQISCSGAGGATTGTCTGNYLSGTVLTLTANATGTSTFLGWGGACAATGTSPTCIVTMNSALNVTASFVQQNFGNVNVCPSGQTTPAPCSNTLALTYNLATTTAFGAIQVVTQGATGLDFTLGSGSTCTGTISAGNSCTVNVAFAPRAPGLRLGAVHLFDNSGNLLATAPIYGIGEGPAIAFGPGTLTTVPASGLSSNTQGVAVDAAGNVYIADYQNNKVMKVTPGGNQTTVTASGLNGPNGVAVDGAGDVFITNVNGGGVVEVTPLGVQTVVSTPGLTLNQPSGIAMDGAGNLFIADTKNNRAVEVPANGGNPIIVGVGLNIPSGLAVDAAGDLFIADTGNHRVVKVANGTQTQVNNTLTSPSALAVDAAGDVFIADSSHNTVVEVTPGGVQTTVSSTPGAAQPYAVALDATGDVFIANSNVVSNQVVEINRSQLSLSFATTNVNSTSSDSPQLVSVQNVGNQPLTGLLALSLGTNFTQNLSPDCSSAFALAPGAVCRESFTFTPQGASLFKGAAVFTDNTLNSSPLAAQTINLGGAGQTALGATAVTVPNVVGQAQSAAAAPITGAGLVLGSVTAESSNTVPSGSVIDENPAAGTAVNLGSAVDLLVSTGKPQPPAPNPLSLENNYFVTGDFASAGVTLRGTGTSGMATNTITIPSYNPSTSQGVPDGADIVESFLYWETLENTPSASGGSGTFRGYSITGQQIGNDIANYTDGNFTGTLRVYRADVNTYFPVGANGVRSASGAHTVSLPDRGTALPLTEGASLVVIYRVLSQNFPLKAVVIYDGSALPASSTVQVVQGFYDAVGGAGGTGNVTDLFASGGSWNDTFNSVPLGQANQFNAMLNPGSAYAAVIVSTPVNNPDNDGILGAWKAGPPAGDFHAGQPGYYEAKTGSWVPLPGAKHGQKDLFVQLDYMCGGVLLNGSCDPTKENLFPSPDAQGKDPLAMVQQAFAATGVQLHLQVGNAIPEDTCADNLTTNPQQLCQFPNQPGVIGWKNSLEFSKLWPRNLASCAAGGDCTTRFPYGQKDSYHYVLFGHSLAIPAWNTRYGTLVSIQVLSGVTTIVTADRGSGINACPSRITISGVLGNPSLNGVYNTTGCTDTKTITAATPGVPNWSYPNNTLPEPVIGLTSGTITSISGYSDLGGADSAVTLGLWLTAPNQDMSKRANVIAGTLFHEIGHTLGLSHGGIYFDGAPNSYVPTFEANCKPNYQSVMNYLFQLDLVGPNQAVAFSNQTLTSLNESAPVAQLTDVYTNLAATYPTSAWYVPYTSGAMASPATRHCDGTPLNSDSAYRIDSSVSPITPPWSSGQDINFDGVLNAQMRGYNDFANIDLRQVGATGGEFASLASVLSFGSTEAPLNIGAGGNVTLGSGGTVALGSGGNVTLGSGGNVTLGSGGTITLGSGGNVTLGSGGNVTLGSGGTVTPGSSGNVILGSGGNVTLGSGGTITLGSGGNVTLGSGGTVTLGSGGTISLNGGGTVTIPSTGGTYTIGSSGGNITLGSGGNVTLGSGGNVTLGSGGTIALGSGGNVTLGSGGNVTLGSGGTIALGSGGNVTLGSGGNVTLGSGGNITLGSGGNVTLGSGGNVTLGSGGTVTLGSGGNVTLGSGGNVTLGSGGTATLGAGGTVTLGSGGNVTLGSGGNVTLGSGGTVTPSGGTPVVIAAGGSYTFGSGGGTVTLGSGGNVTLGSGGTVTLGSGGNVTLGSGGNVTLGSGGNVTLGSGGTVALGSGGNVTLGSGGTLSDEMTYETANSTVRPPTSPAKTPTPTGVRIDWTAPAFGVVATYTIYRSSDGATPMAIGSVSGNPPATTFTDTNPDLTAHTVVYTISTTLVPDTSAPGQRQSPPSPPAVLKNDQTITLGPLPSSVNLPGPQPVTATAMSGGVPNLLQVNFGATGSCSIGSQSIASGVSSASVVLNGTGSCTITASQPGTNAFNAANTVSGTFTILQQGSNTLPQTINFVQLQNVQYGNTFLLSASSSIGQPVSFTASGPCTTSGSTTGVGVCTIAASAPGDGTHSAASVSQSFTIFPAVLKVTASNLTSAYGQPIPSLKYLYSGFVNNETASVVSGTPALSTTATAASNAGSYPITVSTGTLSAVNYSFLYVSGTLTILQLSQTITFTTNPPATAAYQSSFMVAATGGASGNPVTFTSSGPCSNSGATYTMTNSTGMCIVTANQAGSTNYSAATAVVIAVNATGPLVSLSTSNINFGTVYLGSITTKSITVTNIGTAPATINDPLISVVQGGNSNEFVAVNLCLTPLAPGKSCTIIIGFVAGPFYTPQTATLEIIDNAPGSPQPVTLSALVIDPLASFNPTSLSFGTIKHGTSKTLNVTLSNPGATPLIFTGIGVTGANATAFMQTNNCGSSIAAGAKCTVAVKFTPSTTGTFSANLAFGDNAQTGTQTVPLSGKGN
jgi:sugar lactone lactonase YvrE